ncbi:MAG: glycosyl transferase family 90, partial [Bacteroidota bacterium]
NDIYTGPKLMYEENKAVFQYEKYRGGFWEWYVRNLIHHNPFRKIRSLPNYEKYRNLLTLSDFLKLFHNAPNEVKNEKFLLYHGERELNDDIPYIRKARKIDDKHSVLFKLSTIRHFSPCREAKKHDIKWQNKRTEVVWRGATTSAKYRNAFVEKYYEKFNIGFSTTKQYPELEAFKRPMLSIKDQLEYKFIVSLEGYDLASNLKWILSSNSVPIMPKPTWVSWIMEDKLKPYTHYLPLNDKLDNLEELLNWAQKNDQECEQIAQNGKEYMLQFFDEENETHIQHQMLVKYAELFKIN